MQQPVRNGAKHGVSASGSGVAAFMPELEALGVRVEERRLTSDLRERRKRLLERIDGLSD